MQGPCVNGLYRKMLTRQWVAPGVVVLLSCMTASMIRRQTPRVVAGGPQRQCRLRLRNHVRYSDLVPRCINWRICRGGHCPTADYRDEVLGQWSLGLFCTRRTQHLSLHRFGLGKAGLIGSAPHRH